MAEAFCTLLLQSGADICRIGQVGVLRWPKRDSSPVTHQRDTRDGAHGQSWSPLQLPCQEVGGIVLVVLEAQG